MTSQELLGALNDLEAPRIIPEALVSGIFVL